MAATSADSRPFSRPSRTLPRMMRADEAAQAVRAAAVDVHEPEAGAATGIGHQHAQFERGPEVVARIELLGRDDRGVLPFLNGDVADPDGRLEPERRLLPIDEGGRRRRRRRGVFEQVVRCRSILDSSGMTFTICDSCDNVGRLRRDRRPVGVPPSVALSVPALTRITVHCLVVRLRPVHFLRTRSSAASPSSARSPRLDDLDLHVAGVSVTPRNPRPGRLAIFWWRENPHPLEVLDVLHRGEVFATVAATQMAPRRTSSMVGVRCCGAGAPASNAFSRQGDLRVFVRTRPASAEGRWAVLQGRSRVITTRKSTRATIVS